MLGQEKDDIVEEDVTDQGSELSSNISSEEPFEDLIEAIQDLNENILTLASAIQSLKLQTTQSPTHSQPTRQYYPRPPSYHKASHKTK